MTYEQSLFKLPEFVQIIADPIKRQARYTAKISICLVCGDKARIINYGALSCASCKTFFRRHGFRIEEVEPCRFNGNCEITIQSRRICSACRLAKCLTIGMSRDLIRKEDLSERHLISTIKVKNQQNIIQQTRTLSFPLHTLDLLNIDRSNLTTTDWTLFSNIIHAYDIFSPVKSIYNEIACQSKLPLKIRIKFAQKLIPNLLISFYTSLQSYIRCINEFQMFTIAEQKCIYQRNFHSTSSLMGQLILRESGIIENETYLSAFASLYNIETLIQAASIMTRLDYDSTLVKIFLVIISFSSNCFMIDISTNIYGDYILRKTKQLFFYQNQYVELLWKYMIFRYGYKEATFRFAGLIKQIIDLIPLVVDTYAQNTAHHQTIITEVSEKN
ncbi:unnamed protein product [Rotaria sp. Silwood1]|nr:unnamed protein product [Rotaria sp. Silwood1]CAF3710583.1 unnamed protein product [Rotaria sp. Silwood1]CAF4863509.1 unnamed protein product [Rotaria sp. Silwood1]